MWKLSCVVLASILILPLPASLAATGDAEELTVEGPVVEELAARSPGARIPLTLVGGELTVQLPEGLRNLPPEKRRALIQYLEPRPPLTSQTYCLAGDDPSLCAFGAAAARMRPCLAAVVEDCPAFEAWTRVFGNPGIVPADPSLIRAAKWPVKVEPSEED